VDLFTLKHISGQSGCFPFINQFEYKNNKANDLLEKIIKKKTTLK